MTGAAIVFKALEEQGVDTIFGYPGGAVLPIYDELKNHKKIGQEKFYSELLKLDPKVKNFILKSDNQRSIRAYEVKKFTKKSLYDWTENTKPTFDPNLFQKFFIHPPKDLLLQQINLRINRMFKQRVKQEVKKFSKLRIHPDLSANKVIGLQEIKDHLVKKLTLTEVKNFIQIRTRQYAKRQFTWARGKMSSWKIIILKIIKIF